MKTESRPSAVTALRGTSRLLAVAAGAWLAAVAMPAAGDLLRRPYTMRRQLPCGTVTTIAPAGRHVWFGGWSLRPGEEHGIARYDTRTGAWRLFLEPEGVTAEDIHAIAADGDQLWIAGGSDLDWNLGLHRYDISRGVTRRFLPEDGLPHWQVRDIQVREAEVWIATLGGVGRYCKATDTWEAFTHAAGQLASEYTYRIAANDEQVWVGSLHGLEILDRRTGAWRRFRAGDSVFPSPVTAIGLDDGGAWLISEPRVIRHHTATGQFRVFQVDHEPAHGSVLDSLAVTATAVYFGSEQGVHVYQKADGAWQTFTEADGLWSNEILTVAADDQYIWCSDRQGRGVSRYDRRTRRWQRYAYREEIPSDHIYSLWLQGDHLFAGTLGSGFWRYDTRRDEWTNLNRVFLSGGQRHHYAGMKSPVMYSDIRHMAGDGRRLWLATQHGLCVHDPDTPDDFEVLSLDRFPMLSVAVFQDHILCGGQEHGLRVYDPAQRAWIDPPAANGLTGRIVSISADEQTAYLTDTRRIYRLTAIDRPPEQIVLDVGDDIRAVLGHGHRLWIGTGDGLWSHSEAAGAARPEPIPGWDDPAIQTLAVARGRLWVGAATGLAGRDLPDGPWQTFEAPDPLTHPLVSAVTGDDRYLWIAMLGGGLLRLGGPGTFNPDMTWLP